MAKKDSKDSKKKPAAKAKDIPAKKKSVRELSEEEIEKVSGGVTLGGLPGIGVIGGGIGLPVPGTGLPQINKPGFPRFPSNRASDEVVQQKGHVGDY